MRPVTSPVAGRAAFDTRPVPRSWGWPVRGGGRAAHVEGGALYAGTTSQVCGLFPFAVSAGPSVRGVPIGRHLLTAEPVGLDPAEWLRGGLVSNPGIWVQGQPGIGKSALVKRMICGLVAFGGVAVVPGDVKGEYSPLITALGGSVWRLGRGLHSLNPLDAGPLVGAIAAAVGSERAALAETLRARRGALLEALVAIVRRGVVDVTDRRLLCVALDLAVDTPAVIAGRREPLLTDVLDVLTTGAEPLRAIAACRSDAGYRRVARDLLNTLALICDGPIRGIFDRPSTVSPTLDEPALSLDLSALADDPDDVLAAAMLCSWAWSSAVIDAAAGGAGNVTRTEGAGNVVVVQDELWRALRVAPGLVERSDQITRLNRHRGVVSFQVTHSLDDLRALPTEADRAKAHGLVSRNGVVVLGGMVQRELDALAGITPLSVGEAALVTSWAAPPTWVPGARHPGRGRYLVKSGERVGLPVALELTPSEQSLYHTDGAFTRPAAVARR